MIVLAQALFHRIPEEIQMADEFKSSNKVKERSVVSLSVYNVGNQKCTPGYEWGPGIRDHYLIHYVSSGKGTYTVHGITYELEAGDAFLVRPNTEISYRADNKEPWTYYWVGFAGTGSVSPAQMRERYWMQPTFPVKPT